MQDNSSIVLSFDQLKLLRLRSFCFTWPNPPDYWKESLTEFWQLDNALYLVGGYEISPTTHLHHIQGYVQFKNPIFGSTVYNKWKIQGKNQGIRLIPANGEAEHNQKYCTKDGDFLEFGTPPMSHKERTQKNKDEQREFIKFVESGADDREIADKYPYQFAQQESTIRRVRMYSAKKKRECPLVVILSYGPTGVGKTESIEQLFGVENIFKPTLDKNVNFAGYHNQPVILLDEYEGHYKLNILLQMLDSYHVPNINAKYGQVIMQCKVIVLTCNKHPSTWYDWSNRLEKEAALRRRFYDEALVLDNLKKVTKLKSWWPITYYDDGPLARAMPEKNDYDHFIPVFIKPVVTKRWTLEDIKNPRNAVEKSIIEEETRVWEQAEDDIWSEEEILSERTKLHNSFINVTNKK